MKELKQVIRDVGQLKESLSYLKTDDYMAQELIKNCQHRCRVIMFKLDNIKSCINNELLEDNHFADVSNMVEK